MARPRTRIPLHVYMNGRLIGRLRKQSSGAIDFQYDETWLANRNVFPISLSLPLREDRYIGAPVEAVFDNLLPDTEQIRRQIAQRVGAAGYDTFSLLSEIGKDCVGAMQFLPEGIEPGPVGAAEGRLLSAEDIAGRLKNLAHAPLGLGEDNAFRISIAGAQEKTGLLRLNGHWYEPIGTSPTTHIFKPQIGRLPNGIDLSNSVENEYSCLKLVEGFGIKVPTIEMATFGDRRVLIIERFDRLLAKDDRLLRLPQEDLCQALSVPSSLKYQSMGGPGLTDILGLLKGSDTPDADRITVMKAQILFWLIGATDGHAKNFSIFIRPGGTFQLTPLYDVLTVEPSYAAGQITRNQMKLAMAVGDRNHYRLDEIAPRHFLQSGAKAGLPARAIKDVLDEIHARSAAVFEGVKAALPREFPGDIVESLEAACMARLRLWERNTQES